MRAAGHGDAVVLFLQGGSFAFVSLTSRACMIARIALSARARVGRSILASCRRSASELAANANAAGVDVSAVDHLDMGRSGATLRVYVTTGAFVVRGAG